MIQRAHTVYIHHDTKSPYCIHASWYKEPLMYTCIMMQRALLYTCIMVQKHLAWYKEPYCLHTSWYKEPQLCTCSIIQGATNTYIQHDTKSHECLHALWYKEPLMYTWIMIQRATYAYMQHNTKSLFNIIHILPYKEPAKNLSSRIIFEQSKIKRKI